MSNRVVRFVISFNEPGKTMFFMEVSYRKSEKFGNEAHRTP